MLRRYLCSIPSPAQSGRFTIYLPIKSMQAVSIPRWMQSRNDATTQAPKTAVRTRETAGFYLALEAAKPAAEQQLPTQAQPGTKKSPAGKRGASSFCYQIFCVEAQSRAWTKQSSNQATGPPEPITARQGFLSGAPLFSRDLPRVSCRDRPCAAYQVENAAEEARS